MTLSKLEIKNYCIPISIGCDAKEYTQLQDVSFDVLIQFAKLPTDCLTDELFESYCYAKLTELIKEICQQKHYQLIEHVAYTVFQEIKKQLKSADKLSVRVHKLNPPLSHLEGGAVFSCYDK